MTGPRKILNPGDGLIRFSELVGRIYGPLIQIVGRDFVAPPEGDGGGGVGSLTGGGEADIGD